MSSYAGCIDWTGSARHSDSDNMAISNQHLDMLNRLVSAANQRHQVISQNIANVNTPNYKRLELNFEAELAKEIQRGSSSRAQKAAPQIHATAGLLARADGNNVDIDKEVGQLTKNAMLQQAYLQLMGTEMSQMRRAMEGG